MALNLPSFRRPLNVDGKDPKQVADAIRTLSNVALDHMQAFAAMGKITGTAATGTTSSAAGVSGATEQIIQQTVNQTVINQSAPLAGFVNDQTGVTAYITQQSDYGNEIVLNDASPITVTLNTAGTSPGIALPWYTFISNQGTGTATLTPATGTINGVASVSLPSGSFAVVFFDGTNFTADMSAVLGSVVTQIIAGAGISLSPVGGTGAVTVTNTGISGYPSIVTSAISTAWQAGTYSWTSPALVAAAIYRVSAFVYASTTGGGGGTVTGTVTGIAGGINIPFISFTVVPYPGAGYQSATNTFYSSSTATITLNFSLTGLIQYQVQAIVLERLA